MKYVEIRCLELLPVVIDRALYQEHMIVGTLVNKADTAMYRVKERGRGGYPCFSAM